jgi:hypothetical protein
VRRVGRVRTSSRGPGPRNFHEVEFLDKPDSHRSVFAKKGERTMLSAIVTLVAFLLLVLLPLLVPVALSVVGAISERS